jgi:hypothetical protein
MVNLWKLQLLVVVPEQHLGFQDDYKDYISLIENRTHDSGQKSETGL